MHRSDVKSGFRARVDEQLDGLVARFGREIPSIRRLLDPATFDLEYYKRHNIETILRIRLKRTCDAYMIRYFTKHDAVRAKAWAHYTDDEMLHDTLFARDLEAVGASHADIYGTEPFLATKMMMGYFLYDFEYADPPLALLASVYLMEYTSVQMQPLWLDALAKVLGEEKIRGARAHVNTDMDGDHADFVWHVLVSLARTQKDEARVHEHIEAVYRLYRLYFEELERALPSTSAGSAAPPRRAELTV